MSNVIFIGTHSRREQRILAELAGWNNKDRKDKDFNKDSEDSSLDLPVDALEED